MKQNLLLVLSLIALVGTMIILNSNSIMLSTKTDCSKPFNVVYLKPSEMKYASEIVDKQNMIVVFPELNQVNAKTDILKCPSFNINNYLNQE